MQWKTDGRQYAQSFHSNPLTFRVKKHQSVLIRKLGDSEQRWQKNKVINLKIASERISTILIKPNETFSFCQLVGLPTIKQGYVEGMELSFGQARGGIGGGICQIANLIQLRQHFDSIYNGFGMPYPFSYANEVVTKGVVIFKMVHGNTKEAILAGVNMGRDTDCVAAVAGGIAGALSGSESIPVHLTVQRKVP